LRKKLPSHRRNGRSGKTVLTDGGPLRIEVPRDRAGSFEPQLIPKRERRFAGFDDRIISMYARGMSVREIQGHLAEMYAIEVSAEFISAVTDAVMAEVGAWQARPLEQRTLINVTVRRGCLPARQGFKALDLLVLLYQDKRTLIKVTVT
jgi:transposase-like protein